VNFDKVIPIKADPQLYKEVVSMLLSSLLMMLEDGQIPVLAALKVKK